MNTEEFEISYLNKLIEKSKPNRQANKPIVPIREVTKQLAKLYCLNNFEISTWQYRYLLMWKQNSEHSYITSEKLMEILDLINVQIIHQFFAINNNRVTAENIVLFICVFCFMDVHNTIKILLSVCNINSNRVINPNLLHNFFLSFNSTKEDKLINDISPSQPGDYTLPIIVAVEIIKTNVVFNNVINQIKDNIIKRFITYPDYYGIIHRQAYYDQISSGIAVSIPFEPCTNKCYRIVFTNKPSPYCTEYRQVSEELDIENLAAQIAVEIRQLFGYSSRLSKVKKPSLSSNNTSHMRNSAMLDLQSPIPLNESMQNESHRTLNSLSQTESHMSFNHFLYSSAKYVNVNHKISRTANFIPTMNSKNNLAKVLPL